MKPSVTTRTPRWFLVAGIGLAALLVGAASYAWFQWTRVVVTVHHRTPGNVALEDLVVSVRGTSDRIDRLPPGGLHAFVVSPVSESSVHLRFRIGGEHCEWTGGYVEPSGGYRQRLEVRGCNEVDEHGWLWP